MENKIITITEEQHARVKEILKGKLSKQGMENYLIDDVLFDMLHQEVVNEVVMFDMLNQR